MDDPINFHDSMNHFDPPRADIYSGIHKALRALMADTLVKLGRMDAEDLQDVAQVVQRVLQMLDFCRTHADHESRFIHPTLEVHAPGTSRAVAYEHVEHDAQTRHIGIQARALLECTAAQRAPAAAALYRTLALFVASNFEHLHLEETVHNAVLWSHCTDAEIMSLHDALVRSVAPEDLMFILRWLVPSLAPAERAATMRKLQLDAPPGVLQAALDVVRPHLADGEWLKLMGALEQEHAHIAQA
ncbi:hypothetical protein [Variovorax paradoxus]|uniref:Hemerythrin-like domain-containing protein n=1 Tax=Variovorax paradoxus (strain EPS) TaxID=595537 RepID=E6VAP2_VARPE|nr:hypothetical protein [Variovorax paradoxus]ADU35152.1 hypothetical protein Varpa_0934 [Variovorax paradoxus EPS]